MAENKDKKVLNVPNKRELTPNTFDTAEHKEVRLKRNVPNLRFKEFEGEWKECRLGEIMNFSEKRINASTLTTSNYISTENMLQDFQGVIEAKSVPNNTNVISFTYGDILISNIRPYLKKVWKASIDGGCSSDVLVMKANDKINNDYLHYVIANNQFINFVMNGAKGVKMPRGDKEQMKTYIVSLPPMVKEQNKIAKFLSLLDERIATQNKIIEELKKLKNGISDKLFKSIKGAVKSLSSIGGIIKGKQINGEFLTDNGEYYVMNGGVEPSGYFDNYNVEANTISISEGGNSCGYVQFNTSPFWSGGHCYTIQKVTSTIDNLYLYHYLKSKEDEIMKLRIGTGLPNIKKKDLANFKIVIPEMEKQKKISNLLSLLERKIENSTALLSCLQAQKQHLLRQMFI